MNNQSKPWAAYACLVSAMVIVGSSVPVGKAVTEIFPVFLASGFRYAIAVLILVPILLKTEGLPKGLTLRDGLILVAQALGGTFVFSVGMLYGLRLTTGAEGGVVSGVLPAMVGLFCVIFLRERMTVYRVGAVTLAVVGLTALNINGDGGAARGVNPLLGDFFILCAIAGESVFLILGKTLKVQRSPVFVATAMSVLGMIMFAPLGIIEAMTYDFALPSITDWIVMGYYGVFITVIAFFLWFSGVEKVPGTTAGIFTAVMPVCAVTFSYIFLGETFRSAHALGCAAVVAAIILAVRSR